MAKQVVWKFELRTEMPIRMPKNARIIRCDIQYGKAFLWAIVDIDAELEDRQFNVYATGSPLPENFNYIGTFTQMKNTLVWHVLEIE